mgnify:CR=1 FL=1
MRHTEYLNRVSPYADFNEAHEWRHQEATGDELCELCGARFLGVEVLLMSVNTISDRLVALGPCRVKVVRKRLQPRPIIRWDDLRAEVVAVRDLTTARQSEKWAAAVKFLSGHIPEVVQQQIRDLRHIQSPDWPAAFHFGWGMGVRNDLRRAEFAESDFGILNLDNIYIELIEEAIQ